MDTTSLLCQLISMDCQIAEPNSAEQGESRNPVSPFFLEAQ